MADKLLYIPIDDTQIPVYYLKRTDNQLKEPINRNLIKVPKVVKPTNKKTLL